MSLNLVRNNSSSPFRLQRSMVDQGGEGGAYESGGYTGKSEYSDGGMGEAISSFGKVVGAGIQSRTAGDENKSNEKKAERLEKRSDRIEGKKDKATTAGNTEKANRLDKRNTRVEAKKEKTTAEIKKYNESQKPTAKSDIAPVKDEAKAIPSTATAKTTEGRKESVTASATKLLDSGTITKSDEEKKKDRENEVKGITPINQKRSGKYKLTKK